MKNKDLFFKLVVYMSMTYCLVRSIYQLDISEAAGWGVALIWCYNYFSIEKSIKRIIENKTNERGK